MDLSTIGKTIWDIAPGIAGALLGPPGAAAVTGIKVLAGALGLAPDARPDDISQVLSGGITPELRLAIMTAENNFVLQMRALEIEELKAQISDVQNARQRQIEVEKATGNKDINLYILAWTVVCGFFLLLYFLLRISVPADQSGVVYMLFGALSTGFVQVLAYFFGSSKSSADKNSQIGQIRRQIGEKMS